MSRKALGTLLVSVSATAFGTYSLFALPAGRAGIGPVSLLFYRFSIAGVILGLVAILTRATFPARGRVAGLIALGGLYVGQSFTYLQCLRASNPIAASLLLYIYPALVTVGSVLFLHEKLNRAKIVALACALMGSVLIIGPVQNMSLTAVFYGFGTALFYAVYLVSGKRILKDISPAASTFVIIGTAACAYGIASLFTGLDLPAQPSGWIGPIGLAIVATVIAIGALLAGLAWVSPVEASSLSALEPLVSAILAILFLNQELRVWHVAGGSLVIIAVLVLARQSARSAPV